MSGAIAFTAILLGSTQALFTHRYSSGRVEPFTDTLWIFGGFLGVALLLAAAVLLSQLMVRASLSREMAWLSELPFPIRGHFRMLGGPHGQFQVEFKAESPDAETLAELLAGISPALLELKSKENPFQMRIEHQRDAGGHSRWRAWRIVVDQLLLPLHSRFPIAGVTFDR